MPRIRTRNRIREVREKKGVSLFTLCRLLTKKKFCICAVEQGFCEAREGEKKEIAKALGVTMEDVFPTTPPPSLREIIIQGHKAANEKAKSLGWTPPEDPDGGHSSGTQG